MSTDKGVNFDVRRNNQPITDIHIKDSINPGISYKMEYELFDAAIAAGASLDELAQLDDYPKKFRAKLIAWHQLHGLISMHVEDAVSRQAKKKSRGKH